MTIEILRQKIDYVLNFLSNWVFTNRHHLATADLNQGQCLFNPAGQQVKKDRHFFWTIDIRIFIGRYTYT